MATCSECSIFLLSTDECPHLQLAYAPELLKSPSACPGCRMLLRGVTCSIPELEHFSRTRPDGVKIRFWRPGPGDLLVADVQYLRDVGFQNNVCLEFYTLPDQPSPWPGFAAANHLPQDPSANDRCSTIRHWIQRCATDHKTCVSSQPPPLPTRVVKISPANTVAEPFGVSLYETLGEAAEYNCLSYCWGGRLPIRTTTSTLDLFKHSISWAALPKTFQDALQLTSMLGIQFIWIDALCIVQDDKLDWARESAKMADIYSRSYLTIGAALAKNCDAGCFVLEDKQPGVRHEVRDYDPNGSPYSIYIRQPRHDEGPTIDSVYPAPSLLSRSWAFQERLLSPRVVFFGPQEMFYECNAASLCECSLGEARNHIDNVRDRLRDIMSNLKGDQQRLVDLWHELVVIYSSMKLTFQDDVLPAISGVAHRIQDWTGSRYYAGIWSHSIVEDLRWKSRFTQKERPKRFLAPTWSWASTGGASKYDAPPGNSILPNDLIPKVLDIDCTLKSTDTCGGVVTGYITMRGLCLEAEMTYYPHELASEGYLRAGVVTRKDYTSADSVLFRFTLDHDLSSFADTEITGGIGITCLLLDVQRVNQDARSGYIVGSALMLRQSELEKGSYERIGYVARQIDDKFIMGKAEMKTVRIT